MKPVVVDTTALSWAFRRAGTAPRHPCAAALEGLLEERGRVILVPGIVLQEILSGVRSEEQFDKLRRSMNAFVLLLAKRAHHVLAARIAGQCGARGVAAGAVDCLVAATTLSVRGELLTVDADFERMTPICGLELVAVR